MKFIQFLLCLVISALWTINSNLCENVIVSMVSVIISVCAFVAGIIINISDKEL